VNAERPAQARCGLGSRRGLAPLAERAIAARAWPTSIDGETEMRRAGQVAGDEM